MRNLAKSCCASILVAALLLPCVVHAYTAYDDHGNQWIYQLCDGGCEIVGTPSSGTYLPAVSSAVGDLEIPETLGGYDVVRIGDKAFYTCTALTGLSIPKTVTSIDPYAFLGCTGLLSFEVDSRNNSYQASSDGFLLAKGGKTLVAVPGSFSSVTIPSGVTSIGPSAFSGSLIESIEVPAAVTNIGECAFAYCGSLGDVVISADGADIVIGDMAFVGCPFYSVSIPSRVKSIGRYAFAEGPGAPVDPSVIVTPSMYAVYVSFGDTDRVKGLLTASNHNIEDVTFVELDGYGNMYAEIDGYKWSCRLNDDGCTVSIARADEYGNLRSAVSPMPIGAVAIPGELCGYPVVNIGRNALNFSTDPGITDVTIPSGVTNIGVCAFAWCSSMTNITISHTVRSIGDQAFQDCRQLVSVDIPDSVESIGETAFWGCCSLSRVKLSLGMTSLAPDTFLYCSGLTRVTLPPSVTNISDTAFNGVDLSQLTISVLPGCVDAAKEVFRRSGYTTDQINNINFEVGDGSGMVSHGDNTWYFKVIDGKAVLGRNLDFESPTVDHVAVSPRPSGCFGIPAHLGSNAEFPVVGVGYLAFKECTELTQVNIQGNVTNINPYAFIGCTGLKENGFAVGYDNMYYKATESGQIGLLLTKDGVTLVAVPGGLTSVMFPEGVTSIGTSAFNGGLVTGTVQIPSAVTNIGECAFAMCMNLTSVEVSDGGADLYIGNEAFAMCRYLTSATIPSRVKGIGNRAFSGSGLNTVYVSAGDTSRVIGMFLDSKHDIDGIKFIEPNGSVMIGVGDSAWRFHVEDGGAEIYGSVVFPAVDAAVFPAVGDTEVPDSLDGYPVTSIGSQAFYACSQLTALTIPYSVTNIDEYAFLDCTGLQSFEVDPWNDYYQATDGVLLTKDGETLVAVPGGLSSVTIPSGVTCIGPSAFNGGRVAGEVQIPAGVTNIAECAFAFCSYLTSVVIPDGLADFYIGSEAFAGCANLKSMRIPSCVKGIGQDAFKYVNLEIVYVNEGDTDRVKGLLLASGLSGEDISGITFVEGSWIKGDADAKVTGNATDGYEVVPSPSAETVEVDVPEGIDPEKVTVVLPPTASVKRNGAKVKVVKGENDITAFLDIPAPDASGVTDLNAAVVKEEVVREVFDADKGADVKLDASNPSITTSPTHPGLTYTFSEGTSLEGLTQKLQKAGDGNPWTPEITVKGGRSGFYSIRVTK